MGTFIEKHLIANVWELDWKKKTTEKKIDKYINKIKKKYRNLFGKFESITNGFLFYFMAWDGSKEWWDTQREAEKIREDFIKFIKEVSPNSTILFIKENKDDEDEPKPNYIVHEIDKRNWVEEK